MHVEICPICKGEGQVCIGMTAGSTAAPPSPMLAPCYGCGTFPHGRGWIVVPDVMVAIPGKQVVK